MQNKERNKKEGMDVSPFKLDIDELIKEYDECNLKSFADFKRVWLARKFSFIFDAHPSNANLPALMQSLYAHCIGHITTAYSLSRRLGGLYCLYCLYEIQPFKPVFKIYISLGELRRLKVLLVDAKENGIEVVYALIRRMLERNAFLFGFVDMDDYSETERVKEFINLQNAIFREMHEKLLANIDIEHYLHTDMGVELDLVSLKKITRDYADAKKLAIKEAEKVTDVGDVQHIAENLTLVSDQIEKITEDWNCQKEMFYQRMGSNNPCSIGGDGGQDKNDEVRPRMELVRVPTSEIEMKEAGSPLNMGFVELLTGEGGPGHGNEEDDYMAEINQLLDGENDEAEELES